jgi:hypothetical protein
MHYWLRCTLSPGQFSDEYAVYGHQHNGRDFSLFAPKELTECAYPPTEDEDVEGWLQVKLWEKNGEWAIVELPDEPFECHRWVTVSVQQLKETSSPQAVP